MNASSPLQKAPYAEMIPDIVSAHRRFRKRENAFMLCRRCGALKVQNRAKFQSRLTTNLPLCISSRRSFRSWRVVSAA